MSLRVDPSGRPPKSPGVLNTLKAAAAAVGEADVATRLFANIDLSGKKTDLSTVDSIDTDAEKRSAEEGSGSNDARKEQRTDREDVEMEDVVRSWRERECSDKRVDEFTILQTDPDGNCFYEAVSKVIETDISAGQLREMVASLFELRFPILDPRQRQLYKKVAVALKDGLTMEIPEEEESEYKTELEADPLLRAYAYDYAERQRVDTDYNDSMGNMMRAYGKQVSAYGKWANHAEILATSGLLGVGICIYTWNEEEQVAKLRDSVAAVLPIKGAIHLMYENAAGESGNENHYVGMMLGDAMLPLDPVPVPQNAGQTGNRRIMRNPPPARVESSNESSAFRPFETTMQSRGGFAEHVLAQVDAEGNARYSYMSDDEFLDILLNECFEYSLWDTQDDDEEDDEDGKKEDKKDLPSHIKMPSMDCDVYSKIVGSVGIADSTLVHRHARMEYPEFYKKIVYSYAKAKLGTDKFPVPKSVQLPFPTRIEYFVCLLEKKYQDKYRANYPEKFNRVQEYVHANQRYEEEFPSEYGEALRRAKALEARRIVNLPIDPPLIEKPGLDQLTSLYANITSKDSSFLKDVEQALRTLEREYPEQLDEALDSYLVAEYERILKAGKLNDEFKQDTAERLHKSVHEKFAFDHPKERNDSVYEYYTRVANRLNVVIPLYKPMGPDQTQPCLDIFYEKDKVTGKYKFPKYARPISQEESVSLMPKKRVPNEMRKEGRGKRKQTSGKSSTDSDGRNQEYLNQVARTGATFESKGYRKELTFTPKKVPSRENLIPAIGAILKPFDPALDFVVDSLQYSANEQRMKTKKTLVRYQDVERLPDGNPIVSSAPPNQPYALLTKYSEGTSPFAPVPPKDLEYFDEIIVRVPDYANDPVSMFFPPLRRSRYLLTAAFDNFFDFVVEEETSFGKKIKVLYRYPSEDEYEGPDMKMKVLYDGAPKSIRGLKDKVDRIISKAPDYANDPINRKRDFLSRPGRTNELSDDQFVVERTRIYAKESGPPILYQSEANRYFEGVRGSEDENAFSFIIVRDNPEWSEYRKLAVEYMEHLKDMADDTGPKQLRPPEQTLPPGLKLEDEGKGLVNTFNSSDYYRWNNSDASMPPSLRGVMTEDEYKARWAAIISDPLREREWKARTSDSDEFKPENPRGIKEMLLRWNTALQGEELFPQSLVGWMTYPEFVAKWKRLYGQDADVPIDSNQLSWNFENLSPNDRQEFVNAGLIGQMSIAAFKQNWEQARNDGLVTGRVPKFGEQVKGYYNPENDDLSGHMSVSEYSDRYKKFNDQRKANQSFARVMALLDTYPDSDPKPGITAFKSLQNKVKKESKLRSNVFRQVMENYEPVANPEYKPIRENPSKRNYPVIFELKNRLLEDDNVDIVNGFPVVDSNIWKYPNRMVNFMENVRPMKYPNAFQKVSEATREVFQNYVSSLETRMEELKRDGTIETSQIQTIWPKMLIGLLMLRPREEKGDALIVAEFITTHTSPESVAMTDAEGELLPEDRIEVYVKLLHLHVGALSQQLYDSVLHALHVRDMKGLTKNSPVFNSFESMDEFFSRQLSRFEIPIYRKGNFYDRMIAWSRLIKPDSQELEDIIKKLDAKYRDKLRRTDDYRREEEAAAAAAAQAEIQRGDEGADADENDRTAELDNPDEAVEGGFPEDDEQAEEEDDIDRMEGGVGDISDVEDDADDDDADDPVLQIFGTTASVLKSIYDSDDSE